jgi:glycine cleavage system H protein
MSRIDENVRYTESHEWVRKDGDRYVIGISDYAQHQLGDIVMVELPQVGARAVRGQPLGVIEAVKTATDFMAPMDGSVLEVNSELDSSPETVNAEPYGAGWLVAVKADNEAQFQDLLTPEQYRSLAGE